MVLVESRHTLTVGQGYQTQIAPRAKLGPIGQPEDRTVVLTQQWRYLNCTRNSFLSYFLQSYREQ